jgi:hypothetical protein
MNASRQIIPRLRKSLPGGLIVWGIVFLLVQCCSCAWLAGGSPAERRGKTMSREILNAMGGRGAWEKLRYLHFTYILQENGQTAVRRAYFWDRALNRIRQESMQDDQPCTVLTNLNTGQGIVYLDNTPLESDRATAVLAATRKDFINDLFWMTSPLKMVEPGARVEDAGVNSLGGRICPTVALTYLPPLHPALSRPSEMTIFGKLLFYIDTRTGRPMGQSFVPPGAGATPVTYLWSDWTQVGDFWFPTRLEQVGGRRSILYQDVYMRDFMANTVFQRL